MRNQPENPEGKMGRPIESWTKEQFIEHGKLLLGGIKEMAPDISGGSHSRGIFASIWIADHIRGLYQYTESGKFTLEELGTTEEELKEAIAPSKLETSSGEVVTMTQEERDEIWQQVFEKTRP